MLVWFAVVAAAVLIGLDKSFLPGAGILGLGILANVIPAKQASGTSLALLIVADWMAIWLYRRDVDWGTLRRLLPNVAFGIVLGAGFLFVADDTVTRRTIGVILLVFIGVNVAAILRRRRGANPAAVGADPAEDATGRRVLARRVGYGGLAGFTTMVANAGGPVTSLYFMSEGFAVMRFLGTTAWFYLIVNLVKVPFSLSLGMIGPATLGRVVAMVPVIGLTVVVGRRLAGRLDRGVFNTLVVILTVVSAVELLF